MINQKMPPVDRETAAAMWDAYRAHRPEAVEAAPEYSVERFGDHAQLVDELLALVLGGRKRATADLVAQFIARGDLLPRIGGHWVSCDGRGVPRVVLRTTGLRVGPFTSVDASFAADEGEEDGSLEAWQREHRVYFARVSEARGAAWSEDDEVVFERFAVVWPPELAD